MLHPNIDLTYSSLSFIALCETLRTIRNMGLTG